MRIVSLFEPDHNLVPEILDEYGTATRVALAQYLSPREPHRHLYSLVADYPRRGGRMLRPSLCIATARAFGAPLEDAIRTAVAIELLHNAFLVHDDVEDESETRRGRATLQRLHGLAVAVNVGDALTLLGLRALMDNRWRLGTRVTLRLLEDAERMARESVEGQAIELGWRRDNALYLTDANYLEMVLKKTCWYTTIFPVRAAVLSATRAAADTDRFLFYGFFLGAAFQIQDDVLNLEGDASAYGKELSGDLWEGKRTLILLHLLRVVDESGRERIHRFLAKAREERTEDEVGWLRGLVDAHGSIAHARTVAHGLAGAAGHEGTEVFANLPESRDRTFLERLPSWVLARS